MVITVEFAKLFQMLQKKNPKILMLKVPNGQKKIKESKQSKPTNYRNN